MKRMSPLKCLLIGTVALICFAACNSHKGQRKEVEAMMQRYDRMIQKMNGDSIAMIFTADGELGKIAHGRDSIARFLNKFKNVKVLSMTSTTKSIVFNADSAIQDGVYFQTAVVNAKDTFTGHGLFHAKWLMIPGEGWRVKRMETQPLR